MTNEKTDQLFIFFHTPKTGGTAVSNVFRDHYKKEEILDLNFHWLGEKKVLPEISSEEELTKKRIQYLENISTHIKNLSKEERNGIKLIMGHNVFFGLHELFEQSAYYFTFIREPVERIISEYNFLTMLCKSKMDVLPKSILSLILEGESIVSLSTFLKNKLERSYSVPYVLKLFKIYEFYESNDADKYKFEKGEKIHNFNFIGTRENLSMDSHSLFKKMSIAAKVNKTVNASTKYIENNEENKRIAKKYIPKEEFNLYNQALHFKKV